MNLQFFSLHTQIPSTITFKLDYSLFYYFYAEISQSAICSQELTGSAISTMLTSKRVTQNDVKISKRHPDAMHESCLTPSVRRHFLAPVGFTEIPVGYARIYIIYVHWVLLGSGSLSSEGVFFFFFFLLQSINSNSHNVTQFSLQVGKYFKDKGRRL